MPRVDVAVIGGGIVGLATAYQLTRRHPDLKVLVLEKEAELAQHQTGRNSGVIHSGIYYRPGSLKAKNCRLGKEALLRFLGEEDIAHEICGKVIVAVTAQELPRLQALYQRGQDNGVRCELVSPQRLRELEPHAAGQQAIWVPETGIVDYRQVCARLAARVRERGHRVLTSARVLGMERRGPRRILFTARPDIDPVEARFVVNCAGLQSDRVARLSGQRPAVRIVPFRGEYYKLRADAPRLCKNLIYPVPDPEFPFLGVHFTRLIGGALECGPNAVLALAREGYGKFDASLRDLLSALCYPGFLRLCARHYRVGAGELWRSFSKAAFVRALQRLVPEVRAEHLAAAPCGIRAQAVAPDGALLDDFLLQEADGVVNVCNAPSPAATASLNIGRTIAETLGRRLGAAARESASA